MTSGVLAGYPMVDVKVEVFDGSYHDVDSSEMAFKIAGSIGFKDGAARAGPVLLEPIMAVEVITPDDYMGDVIGDLNSRRGKIHAMNPRTGAQIIEANVPLAEMFGYATDLRSKTQGRATYTMQFAHYAQVPTASRRPSSPRRRAPRPAPSSAPVSSSRKRGSHGQGEVRAYEAARERRHDRARRPRQDDADGGDHEGAGEEGLGARSWPTTRSTRRRKSGSAGSRSRPRTWSTRRRSATTRTSTARATRTTSRT